MVNHIETFRNTSNRAVRTEPMRVLLDRAVRTKSESPVGPSRQGRARKSPVCRVVRTESERVLLGAPVGPSNLVQLRTPVKIKSDTYFAMLE